MTKPMEWDRHEILAALRRKGMTLAGLAEQYNLAKTAFSTIWSRPNEKAERAIADFLGEELEALFPLRYPKNKNKILKQPLDGQTRQTRQRRADVPSHKAA